MSTREGVSREIATESSALLLNCNGSGQHVATPLPKLELSIFFLIELCEALVSSMTWLFIPLMVMELDIDKSKVGYYAGMIASTYYIAQAMTVLIWSRISDLRGRRPIILMGLAALGTSTFCFGLSKTVVTLAMSQCIAGLFDANLAVGKSLMADITDETNRSSGFGTIMIIWACGNTLAPFIAGTLAFPARRFPVLFTGQFWKIYPFFLPCASISAFIGLSFVLTMMFFKETVCIYSKVPPDNNADDHQRLDSGERERDDPTPWRDLFVFRVYITLANYAALAFLQIGFQGLWPLFLSLPIEFGGLGLPPLIVGMCLSIQNLISGIFQVLFYPYFFRKFGPKPIFCAGVTAYMAIFLVLPVISSAAKTSGVTPFIWTLLGLQMTLLLIGDIAFSTILIYIAAAAPDRRSVGATTGLSQTVASIVRSVGPALVMSAFSFSVQHDLLHGYAVYLLLVILAGLTLLLAMRLPTKIWQQDEERSRH